MTPSSDLAALGAARVQVGVLGVLADARDFAAFPPNAMARVTS